MKKYAHITAKYSGKIVRVRGTVINDRIQHYEAKYGNKYIPVYSVDYLSAMQAFEGIKI